MQRLFLALFWLMASPVFAAYVGGEAGGPPAAAPSPKVAPAVERAKAVDGEPVRVVVIPVREQIADPILYIIRRGLKSAGKTDLVILDMETPGGYLGTALEIMEALDQFEGATATYINTEAISAGAFISSVTQDIYFAPKGVIGAAAAVSSGGADIGETMKLKINSYLKAKVRAYGEGRGYRSQVISAMMDADYELKIGEEVVKPKGELLSLTDVEAAKTYGEPPIPLLSAGTYKSLDELLTARFGEGNYRIEKLEVTWSEDLAQLITDYASVLLGVGLLLLFIEFKTPGFGFFGISGGLLLLVFFFGHYAAGLSGYEPAIFFALGLLLLLCELVFFPGVIVTAVLGVLLMFGSLLWSMMDRWPSQPLNFSGEMLAKPATNLLLGIVVTVTLAGLLARFLPKGWFFTRIAVSGVAGSVSQVAGLAPEEADRVRSLIGARGVVATGLFPSGQIEIDGRRYEARLALGTAEAGTPVVVVQLSDFGLVVEVDQS